LKKYLLDTNICIFYLRGRYDLKTKIEKIGYSNCFISEITLAELKYGAHNSNLPGKNLKVVNEFQKEFQIIPIFGAIDIYSKEKARLRKSGILIDDFDLLIGSIAVANDLIIVTNNRSHFERIKGIVIEDWAK
jgi:tRNA(fMet)-specific endonuclease VapC